MAPGRPLPGRLFRRPRGVARPRGRRASALRPPARPAEQEAMSRSCFCVIAVTVCMALGLSSSAGATPPAGADMSRFERPLDPSAGGPTRVDVDVPLLVGAVPGGGLRDLRILGASGPVPYILVPPSRATAATWLHGTVASSPPTKTESGFELDLRRVAHVD